MARERNGGRLAPPPPPRKYIAVLGSHYSFLIWMAENPKLAGRRTMWGCSNAICVSSPDQIDRIRGLAIAKIIVLQFLPGMEPVLDELRLQQRHAAA